jgi:DNA-binding HxlR family transcriptional regulator
MTSRESELTTAEALRLLGAGASGAILMALGKEPLRTKELTERVQGYTPRTVYRYASKLTEIGVIERYEEPGVPSKVVHSLTEPCGRELYELVDAFADASLTRLPGGEIDANAWGSLGQLADLWESGMIEALSFGPKSPTELARGEHGLSYHQVNRRASLFAISGFLCERSEVGRRRSYELTEQARRAMALIAEIGRWRRHHVVPSETPALTPREAGGILRAALPLVTLPEHVGKRLGIEIAAETVNAGEAVVVCGSVQPDGLVRCGQGPLSEVDARARGDVASLIDMVLDGSPKGVRSDGDDQLIEACLTRLHSVLWERDLEVLPAPAEAMASRGHGAELGYRSLAVPVRP